MISSLTKHERNMILLFFVIMAPYKKKSDFRDSGDCTCGNCTIPTIFQKREKNKKNEKTTAEGFQRKITIYSPPFSGVLFCDNFTHFFPRRGLLNLPSEARQIECTSLGKK